MDYKAKAIECVEETVLPLQLKQFIECGGSLDKQYEKYGDTEYFFGRVIEPGRVYEIGYPRCVCPEALSGKATDPGHCECSRQSILFILGRLLPEKRITVKILKTVLSGGENCRFLVTVEDWKEE